MRALPPDLPRAGRRALVVLLRFVVLVASLAAARASDVPGRGPAEGVPYAGASHLRDGRPARGGPDRTGTAAGRRELRFDAVRFDPRADGEPDLSRSVLESASFEPDDSRTPRLALVQFEGAPGPAERAALHALGVTPLFYVPDGAYLVRGDAVALAQAAGLRGVRWAGRYRPGYKVARLVLDLAHGRPPHRPLPGEGPDGQMLDVLLAPGAGATGVAAALRASGITVLAEGDGSDPALLTIEAAHARLALDLAELANRDDVLAIVPRGPVILHNDDAAWIGQSYDTVWRQNYAKSATIWNRGLLGEGEVIAIADTGVDPDVCWMIDPQNGLPAPSAVPATGSGRGPLPSASGRRKIIAYNLLGTFQAQATPYDVRTGDPHGTWAAVAAVGDDSTNTTTEDNPTMRHHDGGDGMAPLAKLVVEDLGDDVGALVGLGLPLPTILDQLFEQERDAGARIATNSWGIEGNRYDALSFFADRMVFNHPDFLPVFSAGNAGPFPGSLASPGTAKNVLTVGASDARIDFGAGLDPENVAPFSARGPTMDGRLKPDLVISGSALSTGTSDRAEVGSTCGRFQVNGTSFSAPLAAGFAALAREYYRKGYYPTGTRRADDGFIPSAALIKATLVAGARTMTGKAGPNWSPCVLDTCDLSVGLCNASFGACQQDPDCWYCSGNMSMTCDDDRDCDLSRVADDAPSPDQGWGRLHLDDVLYFSGDARGLAAWDVPRDAGLATGETWRGEVWLGGGTQDLQVVLTWTDPPALLATPLFLVNDLDLRVTAPDGTVYRGNAFAARDRSPFTIEASQPNGTPAADVDNVELVRVRAANATAGVWTIEVVGDSVPGTPWVDGGARQGFALVAVGPVSGTGGRVSFTNPSVACEGTVEVEVVDQNAAAPLHARVQTASGDDERLALTALGGGRFRGSLPIASGLPLAAGSNRLEVADGETLRATYDDATPAHATVAIAVADCSAEVTAGPPAASGGCDADAFLDAGEQADLSVPLVNPGPRDLRGVTARLVSADGRIVVQAADASYGDIPAGGAAAPAVPFRVALRGGTAPRSTGRLALEVRASGWTVPRVIPLALPLETDERRTDATWTERFDTAIGTCHDGSTSPPAGAWYWFDLDQRCATAEPTWAIGLCFNNRQALLPSCSGQIIGTANERHHRLVSPRITTGTEGSTTILERLRFTESYRLRLNPNGTPCDRTEVEIYTNRDGRSSPSGYYRDRSGEAVSSVANVDPSTVSDWVLPPLPDATVLQLIFHVGLNDREGSTPCGSATGVEVRWRVDDIQLDYENVERVDDASACAPACTAPPSPAGVSVRAIADGRVLVAWDPVPGADHYDVYRQDGAATAFAGRVAAPDTALALTLPDAGPFTFAIEAVDASGLCGSALSAPASLAANPLCTVTPAAPALVAAADGAAATCRADLAWSAVAPPCGGPLRYRVYRSADPDFTPGPGTLLAELDATSVSDRALTTGWDARGEPAGTEWTYEVRAVDLASGLTGPGGRARVRAGGPAQSGTWLDDAGDARPAKMTSLTLADETGAGAAWSRSPVAVHRSGEMSYWPDRDPLGQGKYPALACMALEAPAVRLGTDAPELSIWLNYQIEHQWDGLVVELADVTGGAAPDFAPVTPIGGYPGTFANTVAPPCAGSGDGTGPWINGCDEPPSQGCVTGPPDGAASGWREFRFDLGAWAERSVRFRLRLSTDCGTAGDVVADDLSISGALLPTPCTPGACWPPPDFAGLLSATDLDPLAAGGIRLTWGDVAGWGGGGPGVFEVWRDGAMVAELAAADRAWDDAGAEPNADHEYVVVARSGVDCALRSDAPARIRARDCGRLDAAARAAARLSVARTPSSIALSAEPLRGAARYRFRWSQVPSALPSSPDGVESTAPEARHLALEDGLDYFYSVDDAPPPECP